MVLNPEEAKKIDALKGIEKIIDGTLIVNEGNNKIFVDYRNFHGFALGDEDELIGKYEKKGWKVELDSEAYGYFFQKHNPINSSSKVYPIYLERD